MATTKTDKTNKTATPAAPAEKTSPATPDQDKTPPPVEDHGRNMTSHEYDALHGLTPAVEGGNASGEDPGTLMATGRLGLTPLQHVTAIIAGGVVSGMLARTKSYEMLDLSRVAETIGMCAQLADLIMDLEDSPEDIPDIN